eukprot:CAMPEP_0176361378 /NCGR_PEP_ID=MMETSP0126-20121128/17709_1 /TAXON_ID=141414 ORGANISM="Strombidinopsis acuminatum, Strain SPMC142" /NCGR_SAMPLE_ID=MMETSP0126 /ASSEMBLY_ACC=CAM_ASM_000229 /LENGTH=84 /DNA_ID=CAMNT_0017716917 /DNA_START=917 /DNA_END=1171 /DNA_ORIENTATION=+
MPEQELKEMQIKSNKNDYLSVNSARNEESKEVKYTPRGSQASHNLRERRDQIKESNQKKLQESHGSSQGNPNNKYEEIISRIES